MKPAPSDWKELHVYDRRVYRLQKGAPVCSNTLPFKWSEVVETLIEDGFFTREEFKAWGGIEQLKIRYENVRLDIEGFFEAKPEPTSKMGWQVLPAEDLDVFNQRDDEASLSNDGGSYVPRPSIQDTKEASKENADSEEDEDRPPEVADSQDFRTVNAYDKRMNMDKETTTRGGETTIAIADSDQALSVVSSTHHEAEQDLEAEEHLMESMRSLPLSEIGAAMMADDELDAVLGEMVTVDHTPATEVVSRDSLSSSSLSDPDTSIIEPRQNLSSQTSIGNIIAVGSKSPKRQKVSPILNYDDEVIPPTTVGVVPPSVLKAARRMEQQNNQSQGSKRSPHGKSVSASKLANPNTSTTNDLLATVKAPRKIFKRSTRAKSSSVEFHVHEDQPGNTPLIKKQVARHPKSPGTDLKKENLGHLSQAEPNTTANHRGIQQVLTRSPSRRRSGRSSALPPGRSMFDSILIHPSPGLVIPDGRSTGIDRMGPNAFVTPLTPRSTRFQRR